VLGLGCIATAGEIISAPVGQKLDQRGERSILGSTGVLFSIWNMERGGKLTTQGSLGKFDGNAKIILRVTIVGIIANILLVILKSVFGLIFDNLSVLSDAVHSASDLVTSFFIIVAIFVSSPKNDKKHNYGREKIEPLFVLFFAVVIAGVGILLAWQGIEGIISPKPSQFNWYLVIVTIVSLVIKEALFWYGMHHAKRIKSEILKADAWHSRSDSLASIAVLVGLIFSSFMKTNIIESIAVLIVSVMIFKVALDIFRPAMHQLTDRAAGEDVYEKIREVVLAIDGVEGIDCLKTRLYGNKIFVDIEIAVDGDLTTTQSHTIAETVHDTLEHREELRIKHCLVHVNPVIKPNIVD
jgi:cation diffusion facilitator family transporter